MGFSQVFVFCFGFLNIAIMYLSFRVAFSHHGCARERNQGNHTLKFPFICIEKIECHYILWHSLVFLLCFFWLVELVENCAFFLLVGSEFGNLLPVLDY